MFIGLKSLSLCSLHSKPLHGLVLISFSLMHLLPVLPWQHFFLFLGLTNIFMGSLFSISLHRLELITFSAKPGNKCCHGTFLCFLGLKIFLGYLCIPNPCTDFSRLVFWQHLATLLSVSLTYISVDFLHFKPLHE